jgi:formylglycine-generating enzyme required for sulfatase activity
MDRVRWLDAFDNVGEFGAEEKILQWCHARGTCLDRISNSIGLTFLRIPSGTFLMGSPDDEPHRFPDESPQHSVTISSPFYLGLYPVTQRQYERVMGHNPSGFANLENAANCPVDSVSWQDAVEFCRRLSEMPEERKAGRVYRLPTEAEWEHACRAGTDTPFPHPYYHKLSSHLANFDGTNPYGGAPQGPFLQRTSPVGSYPPTGFGLFDMMGNIWEWCADGREEDFYRQSPRVDPVASTRGSSRICRGASWYSPGHYLRSADRGSDHATVQAHYYGFRVACNVA